MSQIAANSLSPVRPQETTLAWLIKIATGPLLVILLLIHLIINHFVGSNNGLMSYADVIAYFRNPLVVGMEILFLVSAVTHSLLGLRSIILDLHPSEKTMGILNPILSIVGVGAVVYGIWLALVIASKGG